MSDSQQLVARPLFSVSSLFGLILYSDLETKSQCSYNMTGREMQSHVSPWNETKPVSTERIDSDISAHHHPLGYLSFFLPIQAINLKCQSQLVTHLNDT